LPGQPSFGTDRAEGQPAVAHVRADEETAYLVELVKPLIELDVGEQAARDDQVPQTGALQPGSDNRQHDALDTCLHPAGNVFTGISRSEPVAHPGDAPAAMQAAVHEPPVQQLEGWGLGDTGRIAVSGETGDLPLVAVGNEAQGLGGSLVEQSKGVEG
jgi:hypothetical protein